MRRAYKAIGVGLISLPLLFGGCEKDKVDYNQPQEQKIQQVQADTTLERKLRTISENLSSRLSESEITDRDYSNLILEQLKAEEILTGDYDDNPENIGYMRAIFSMKLSLKDLYGLKNDYLVLESTPVSDKAQEDIAAYEKFKTEIEEYLKQKIGEKAIPQDNFEAIIRDYVFSNLPNDISQYREYRKSEITGRLIATFNHKFDIVPSNEIVGNYNKKAIKRALEKVEMK